jgi:hypothetical protein
MLLLPLLSIGCVSASKYFGKRAGRITAWGDAHMQRNPTHYAPYVVREYTRFLKGLPSHPSLDGIRAQIHQRRAQAYRAMDQADLARGDEAMVSQIRARSPYFRGTVAPPPGGETAQALKSAVEGRGDPFARPPGSGAPGTSAYPVPPSGRPRPKVSLVVGLGATYLTRRLIRSDSRSHAEETWDLKDDLGVSSTAALPKLSMRIRPQKGKVDIGAGFWTASFNGDELMTQDFYYDGWFSAAGENLRTQTRYASINLFLGLYPSAKLRGKMDFELGLKHVYVETRVHAATAGRHVDATHVPMIYPGLRLHQEVGKRTELGGVLRLGGMFWTSSGFNLFAFSFETELYCKVKINDRLSLRGGAHFEHLSFSESKSGDREKKLGMGFGGGFVEGAFSF